MELCVLDSSMKLPSGKTRQCESMSITQCYLGKKKHSPLPSETSVSTFTGIQTQHHLCWASLTSGDAKSSTRNHRCCVLAENTSLESKAKPIAFTSSLQEKEGIEHLVKDTRRKDQTGAESQAFDIPQTRQCQEKGGIGPRIKTAKRSSVPNSQHGPDRHLAAGEIGRTSRDGRSVE